MTFVPFEYLEKLVALRKQYVAADADAASRSQRLTAEFASANLSLFLPHIPRREHALLIREILFHQAWSGLDERAFFTAANADVNDPAGVIDRAAKAEPFVFCTYHLGSYRILNSRLLRAGVNFSLVIDRYTMEHQGAKFHAIAERCTAEAGSGARMQILVAEESSSVLRALRQLRAGQSLVFYIDGNTGVGGVVRRDEKMATAEFLGRRLFVRQGIAFLSHAGGVPLVPVTCERRGWLASELTFHPAIQPTGVPRDAFCSSATQALYDLLAGFVRRIPEQWEAWLYLHKYLDADALPEPASTDPAPPASDDAPLALNSDRYALLRYARRAALLDRSNFRVYPLSEELAGVIGSYSPEAGIESGAPAEVESGVIQELVSRGVLVGGGTD